MKMLTRIALIGSLVSVLIHGYLTLHYYPLQFAKSSGQSICNLGGKFNCDAVSASDYSAVFGIPVSVWGFSANLILFLMILLAWLEWTERPHRVRRWAVGLAALSVVASVAMGAISLFVLGNYCLLCIALYALSLAIFEAVRRSQEEPFWSGLREDLPLMWAESQSILVAVFAIPVMSFLIHRGFQNNYGADQMELVASRSIASWMSGPTKALSAKPMLSMGPEREKAILTISEFADFRCHHCKDASPTLFNFASAYQNDVRYEFYAFPLDGDCGENRNGLSCHLAFAVHCGEAQGQGWKLHDAIYEKQNEINGLSNIEDLKQELATTYAALGLDVAKMDACLADPSTIDAIRSQAKQGQLADVTGTPTIFGNQKLLPRGQLLPVLKMAREKLLEKSTDSTSSK